MRYLKFQDVRISCYIIQQKVWNILGNLPREAALNGCCLITGIRGAAYFYEDIPIPDIYKLDEKKVSKEDVISLIRNVLADYEKCFSDFNYYRSRILMEKAEFEEDVKSLLRKIQQG